VYGEPDDERYTKVTLRCSSDVLAVPGFPDVSFRVDMPWSLAP
jgi:hypothetical protein